MEKSIVSIAIIIAIGISIAGASAILYFASSPSSISLTEIDYMSELSEKPDDFYLVTREIQSHYMDLCKLDSSYYLQPDFYVESWDRSKHFYESHDYSRWGVYGHGSYPGNPKIYFNETIPGKSWVSFCTFYRTGWNIETWQGVKIVSEENEYFDIYIEPNEFLLGPTFPKFKGLESEYPWAEKLLITVFVKKEPPKGTYKINIDVVNPSEQKAKEWFWEVLKQETNTEEELKTIELCEQQGTSQCRELIESKRKNKYVDAGFIQVGNRLVLEIYV